MNFTAPHQSKMFVKLKFTVVVVGWFVNVYDTIVTSREMYGCARWTRPNVYILFFCLLFSTCWHRVDALVWIVWIMPLENANKSFPRFYKAAKREHHFNTYDEYQQMFNYDDYLELLICMGFFFQSNGFFPSWELFKCRKNEFKLHNIIDFVKLNLERNHFRECDLTCTRNTPK